MDEVVENAVQTQKVRTILGREREVPEIISRNKVEQMGLRELLLIQLSKALPPIS